LKTICIEKGDVNYLIDGPLQRKNAFFKMTGMADHVDEGKARICGYCIANRL
jgi:hypothetical protein